MAIVKENAAPNVVVGAATGQHLCNYDSSISNDILTSNNGTGKSSMKEISMTELYDQVYEPRKPIVEGLLYPGTYIFAGAPKVGKSFYMAQLAYHVAAGLPLWDYAVRQGTVLYLALEDDYARLQKRLSRMFDLEGVDNLYLVTDARAMADGLEIQMEQFITLHSDTVLIIIDTLQRIRDLGSEQYSYSKDYEVIKRLKEFGDNHGICLLIVHHTRKMEAEDSFDMISGTNGLLGAADGAFVLKKKKRTDLTATLSIVGRDQQDQELSLKFDQEKCCWNYVSAETESWKIPPDPVLEAISRLFSDSTGGYEGSASMLLEDLKKTDPDISITANALGRKLNICADRLLNEYGIRYESTRTHSGRCIRLSKVMQTEETEKKD